MKLSHLLTQRSGLLRQAHLANLAFAYDRLADFTQRIGRAKLGGEVTLKHIAPDDDRYLATLTATDGRQSMLEEHFTDEDIMDLADVLSFMTGVDELDFTFRLEDLPDQFLPSIRRELEQANVMIDHPPAKTPRHDDGNRVY